MGIFKRGEEAFQELMRLEVASQQQVSVPRFFLKEDEEAYVLFVDDEGVLIPRHVLYKNGILTEITCLSVLGKPCPLCLAKERLSYFMAFTVIDFRPYVNREGISIPYSKKLMLARRETAKSIYRLKQQYGSLVGAKVLMKRFTNKNASTGIALAVELENGKVKKYDLSKFPKEFATPYNYDNLLAPPNEERLKLLGYMSVLENYELEDNGLEAQATNEETISLDDIEF